MTKMLFAVCALCAVALHCAGDSPDTELGKKRQFVRSELNKRIANGKREMERMDKEAKKARQDRAEFVRVWLGTNGKVPRTRPELIMSEVGGQQVTIEVARSISEFDRFRQRLNLFKRNEASGVDVKEVFDAYNPKKESLEVFVKGCEDEFKSANDEFNRVTKRLADLNIRKAQELVDLYSKYERGRTKRMAELEEQIKEKTKEYDKLQRQHKRSMCPRRHGAPGCSCTEKSYEMAREIDKMSSELKTVQTVNKENREIREMGAIEQKYDREIQTIQSEYTHYEVMRKIMKDCESMLTKEIPRRIDESATEIEAKVKQLEIETENTKTWLSFSERWSDDHVETLYAWIMNCALYKVMGKPDPALPEMSEHQPKRF